MTWSMVVAVCMLLDGAIADWVNRTDPVARAMPLCHVLKAPGHFLFTVSIAAVLAIWHPLRWRAGALLCLCGMTSGLVGSLVKWSVGRTRPFKGVAPFSLQPFRGGPAGLFELKNLSFPSGHAILAFATAECLSVLAPRWRQGFYLGAAIVAAERVLENAHYLGDVVASAALGTLCVHLSRRVCHAACAGDRAMPA